MAMTRLQVDLGLYANDRMLPAVGFVRRNQTQRRGVWLRVLGVGVWASVERR